MHMFNSLLFFNLYEMLVKTALLATELASYGQCPIQSGATSIHFAHGRRLLGFLTPLSALPREGI